MTDYEQLVKALRCCISMNPPETCLGCTYSKCNNECAVRRMILDAAAAIEALQAQLPKRGEFEKSLHEMFDSIWDCDINHPIFQDTVGELMEAVLQAYDTVNTAKTEVQDG